MVGRMAGKKSSMIIHEVSEVGRQMKSGDPTSTLISHTQYRNVPNMSNISYPN